MNYALDLHDPELQYTVRNTTFPVQLQLVSGEMLHKERHSTGPQRVGANVADPKVHGDVV